MTNSISEIKDAIDSLEIDRARKLLATSLRETPNADVYYMASLVAVDDEQKIGFLKKASELDPFHKPTQDMLSKIQYPLPNRQAPPSAALETSIQAPTPKPIDSGKAFVLATVATDQTFLHEIPTLQSAKIAQIYKDDQLAVIFRDERLHWVNVVYQTSTNNPIVGWILLSHLQNNFQCSDQKVNIIDIPISSFEWYSREQVNDVLQQRLAGIEVLKKQLENVPKVRGTPVLEFLNSLGSLLVSLLFSIPTGMATLWAIFTFPTSTSKSVF